MEAERYEGANHRLSRANVDVQLHKIDQLSEDTDCRSIQSNPQTSGCAVIALEDLMQEYTEIVQLWLTYPLRSERGRLNGMPE